MEMQQGPLQSPAWFMLFALLVGLGFGISSVMRFAKWQSGPPLKWAVLCLGIGALAILLLLTFRIRETSGRMADVITIGGDRVQSGASEQLRSHPDPAISDVQLLSSYRPRSDDELRVALVQHELQPASLPQSQLFPAPTWFILVLILLGFGTLLASVLGSSARRSLFPWVVIAMGCSAVALAMLVLIGYRSTSSHSAAVTHAHVVDATQVSMAVEATPHNQSTASAAPGVGRSAYSPAFAGPRDSELSRQSIGVVSVVGISGILLLVVFFCAGLLTSFAYRRPVTAAAGAVPNTNRTSGWLVVPAICLAVLGALAQPALLPSADHDLVRKSVAFGQQQERTNKIWLDLIQSSAKPDGEVQNVPEWLQDRTLTGNQFLLSSGQYSSPQEAENELLPHAAFLLQRAFQETHPWQGTWVVPLSQVRERVVDKQFIEKRSKTIGKFSGDIYRLHMRVDVSPSICETFTSEWKSQIVQHRLQVLGVLFGWIACVLFAATYYFRRAAHPENFVGWWGQIKISAVTVGMTVAAAWILVDVIQ